MKWERVPPEWGDGGVARWIGTCETCGHRSDVELGDMDGPHEEYECPDCDTRTPDERADEFLDEVRAMVLWWAREDREPYGSNCVSKLSGLAHSILTILDGMSGSTRTPFERGDNRMLNDELYSEAFKKDLEEAGG